MEKFGRSQAVTRREDQRFLTGAGCYVDDIAPDDALVAYFLRSTVAHGTIAALDLDDARDMPGVALVVGAAELAQAGVRMGLQGLQHPHPDGTKRDAPLRPILAQTHVRHVGEAVAMIVADTLPHARDAAEVIGLDIDDLPAHVALSTGGAQIHPQGADNTAFDWALGDMDSVDAAIKTAAHVVRVTVPDNRIICNAMEPRGCFAELEDGRLHVAVNGQGVWAPKADLMYHLGLAADDVRVTNPDVGGGFGMKAMRYPETFCVAHATRVLGKPVRWMSDRTEAMLTDNAGRDLVSHTTLSFDANHKITGYKVETIANMGAYNSQFAQGIQTELFAKVLTGVYDVQAAAMHVTGVFTNTTPVDAYRGAGRPEAIFVLERSMDQAARELGVDPFELRRKNFITPDQFPYTTATDVTYDVGEFSALLDQAMTMADVAGFAARRAQPDGKLRGIGLSYYIESILGDPSETTRIVFEDDHAAIYVGTQSGGQGHETVYAQFLSDQSGIPVDTIRVIQGDSDLIPKGGGTGGSRSVTVQNSATLAAVDSIVARFAAFLATTEGAAISDVTFDHERFRIAGSNLTPTMVEVADMIRAAGQDDLLDTSATIKLDNRSFPNGAHIAEVAVDPVTGVVTIEKYTVVDDFGNLINPMLVEGQVHGGVVQGLGQALTERVVYDEDGQLLTATFMDYAMPRADDMPMIGFATRGTPSVYNAMGMKGCGEAGTVGALAAITNAMTDALWDQGVRDAHMPFTPHRVWQMLQAARAAA